MVHEPVAYFEHDADMGIVGRGACVEEAFEHAAAAVFAMMVDPAQIMLRTRVTVEFDEPDIELALVIWINTLLGQARSRGLIFGHFRLRREGAHWFGTAGGEPLNERMERGVEVKGATLTSLAVAQRDGTWEARCVVDV